MKIAICDDEKIIRDKICKLLNAIDRECEITQFQSGDEIINAPDKFDIYILDIEMPGSSGIEVAEKLLETYTNLHIIFLTSHAEHMQLGYRFKAHRFLTKPIDNDQFNEVINSAEKEISSVRMLCMQQNRVEIYLKYSDIIYLESLGDSTSIFTVNGTYIYNKSMKSLLEKLGDTAFFQAHKSNAVSLERILEIGDTDVTLIDADKKIAVSRRNQPLLKKAYHTYLKKNGRVN